MNFKNVLNESGITDKQKFSITLNGEIKRKNLTDGLKSTYVIYKWNNPAIPNKSPFKDVVDGLKQISGVQKGPVALNDIENEMRKDFKKAGLERYVAPPSDSSWSNLKTTLNRIVKNYGKKTRAFDVKSGHDIAITLMFGVADDGKKRFVPETANGKTTAGVVHPKEVEKAQSSSTT